MYYTYIHFSWFSIKLIYIFIRIKGGRKVWGHYPLQADGEGHQDVLPTAADRQSGSIPFIDQSFYTQDE